MPERKTLFRHRIQKSIQSNENIIKNSRDGRHHTGGGTKQIREKKLTPAPQETGCVKNTAEAFRKWVAGGGHLLPYINTREAARMMGVEAFDLEYYCQVYLGDSFVHWRLKKRLETARQLIEADPERSLTSVRHAVGMEDKSNFKRAFFNMYRTSPGEFRQRCRNK